MSEKLEKIAIELHRVDTLGVESYNLLSNGQKQAFRRMAIAVVKMQEEENKQLQQDKAELVEAFKECYEWLDGQLTSEYQFELDKFKAVLEKRKCD